MNHSSRYGDIAEFLTRSKVSQKQDARFGRDLILKSHQRLEINAGIVLDYIRTVFSPGLVKLDDLVEFDEEIAVILMAFCSTHVNDDMTCALLTVS